jgi:DNA-binding HxlR family transcriptional regulator
MHGPTRLSDLKRAIPECSKKMLIDNLHSLEAIGWLEREDLSEGARKVAYSLTAEPAEQFKRIAMAMSWMEQRCGDEM